MFKFLKMYFWDAISNHYIDFKGRASLVQFWYFVLINFVLCFVFCFILPIIFVKMIGVFDFWVLNILWWALLVPSIAITTRRLHDTNRSGWFQLVGLIPVVGWIVLIILLVLGPVNPNKFDEGV
ncbi:MAG: DUF805 domain-containing protein [Endomicrobium sp.]|nr:DUF805 domain-containing protein [Endomicrobium sp.]